MVKTRCLYDELPYAMHFTAKVLAVGQVDANGCYEVVLDETLFFPEQGGQTPDRGELYLVDEATEPRDAADASVSRDEEADVANDAKITSGVCMPSAYVPEGEGIDVIDVQIRDGVIYHTVRGLLAIGAIVRGRIDWAYRFSNMQQHTGEHIFSGTVDAWYGYSNVGFHLSDSEVTMDFDGVLDEAQIEAIEARCNEIIVENLPVEARYPSEEELAQLAYRSKKELAGAVRIVTIPGVDVCACCAPHVSHTGEIGLLKAMQVQNYKGGVRIHILCGYRAIAAFREKNALVAKMMHLLSASEEELPLQIARLQKENKDLSYQLMQLGEQMLLQQADAIDDAQEDVLLFAQNVDMRAVRHVVNDLMERHSGICAVFSETKPGSYAYIIGSSSRDCRDAAATLRTALGARGGGTERMVQGSVDASEDAIRGALGK